MALKILYLSSEVAPFSKTGGLGDVSNALPKALRAMGHDVRIVTPRYRGITGEGGALATALPDVSVDLGGSRRGFAVRQATLPDSDVPVLFIEHDAYFDRDGIYGDSGGDYRDNAERMSFFSLAALETARGLDWKPDVVHANDWQTALVPVYLKTRLASDPFFERCRTVFTVHNIAYQGNFSSEKLDAIGLGWDLFTPEGLEFYGMLNFMKGGLLFADALTTVSPTYAKEIQTEEFGYRLDGVLRACKSKLRGILNGADYDVWSPERDESIARRYSARDFVEGKKANKDALIRELNLEETEAPIIAMITRLAAQKGLDIFAGAFSEIMKSGASIVVLGSGELKYEEMLARAVAAGGGRVAVKLGFDTRLSHQIEAGADMLLMPSHYEPCGLNQLYSMRYGTVPLVRKTGGLADSVVNVSPRGLASGKSTGFVFKDYTVQALADVVRKAVKAYHAPKTWQKIVRAGMAQDFSWDASAARYVELYEKPAKGRSAGRPAKARAKRSESGAPVTSRAREEASSSASPKPAIEIVRPPAEPEKAPKPPSGRGPKRTPRARRKSA